MKKQITIYRICCKMVQGAFLKRKNMDNSCLKVILSGKQNGRRHAHLD